MTTDVDWAGLHENAAEAHRVSPRIHPDDLLWPFIVGHPAHPDPVAAANYYFDDGAESARKLKRIIDTHVQSTRRVSLLEFASGYGMVSRHLPVVLPDVDVLSCDIHSAAVEFIERELAGTAVLSRDRPESLRFGRRFDVVFALSFFSHMPRSSFGRWLAALFDAVAPGGLLVFTTHGLASAPALGFPDIDEDGFWFRPDSEQTDLDSAQYGSTLSSAEYVIRELFKATRAPLVEYRAGYWWGHQDLYIVAKGAGPSGDIGGVAGSIESGG